MIKYLIADDEAIIRKGILNLLKHYKYIQDESQVCFAENGEEAVEILTTQKPEIAFLDINMPLKSGLEVVQLCKDLNLQTMIIIISGYKEFEYAQRAISLGVLYYILKPIKDELFCEAVDKAIGNFQQYINITDMEKNLVDVTSRLQLGKILHNIDADEKIVIDKFGPQVNELALVMININSVTFNDSEFKLSDFNVLLFGVANVISELLNHEKHIIENNVYNNYQLLLLSAHDDNHKKLVNEIYNSLVTTLKIHVSVGISNVYGSLCKKMHEECSEAVIYNIFNNKGGVTCYSELQKKDHFVYPKSELNAIKLHIATAEKNKIKELLNSIFAEDRLLNKRTKGIENIVAEIFDSVSKAVSAEGSQNKVAELRRVNIFLLCDDLRDVSKKLYQQLTAVLDADNPIFNLTHEQIAHKVKIYIDKNYSVNISIKDIANIYALNSNHLGTIIKKETGTSFSKLLINTRLEKACEMLRETHLTTEKIAYSVGFNDVLYFYRIFKKYKGLTATEYRNEIFKDYHDVDQ